MLEIIAEFAQNNIDLKGEIFFDIGEMIKTLAVKGATAVKFQHFKAENIDGPLLWKVSKKYELPIEEHVRFKKMCEDAHVKYLCTPLCTETLDELLDIGLREIKIASCDCGHLQLISDIVARRSKIDRVILSTGMSTMDEISLSINNLLKADFKIDILHCVSSYPTNSHNASLGVLKVLKRYFGHVADIGYSDHTKGTQVAKIARAMGCTIFEKHITPDPDMKNIPDHAFSFPIDIFDKYVDEIKDVDLIIGEEKKVILDVELEPRKFMKRGIWFKKDLESGHKITREDIVVRRPLKGTINPINYFLILDKKLKEAVKKDDPIILENII